MTSRTDRRSGEAEPGYSWKNNAVDFVIGAVQGAIIGIFVGTVIAAFLIDLTR